MGMGDGQGGVIDAQQSAPRPAQFPFAETITMTTYNDSVGVGEVINEQESYYFSWPETDTRSQMAAYACGLELLSPTNREGASFFDALLDELWDSLTMSIATPSH